MLVSFRGLTSNTKSWCDLHPCKNSLNNPVCHSSVDQMPFLFYLNRTIIIMMTALEMNSSKLLFTSFILYVFFLPIASWRCPSFTSALWHDKESPHSDFYTHTQKIQYKKTPKKLKYQTITLVAWNYFTKINILQKVHQLAWKGPGIFYSFLYTSQ